MQLLEVPPKSGYVWLRQGIWLFRKSPLALLALMFPYLLGIMLLSAIPVVGSFLPLIFLPGLSVGFMAACRDIIRNKPVFPHLLLDGFRGHGRVVARRLLVLGCYNALATAIVFLISSLFDNGSLVGAMVFGAKPSDIADGALDVSMLVTMVAYIPVAMLFWFSPVLVAWHEITPAKAMFFSWTACVRNGRAFIVYAICTILASTLLSTLLLMVLVLFGAFKYWGALLTPYAVIVTAILYCTFYASYRGCFGVQEIGAIDPNVAPPEA